MNKIKQLLFYKNNEFSYLKSIQNILLFYVIPFLIGLYYDLFYNSSVTRVSFDCLDCGLSILGMGVLCYILAFTISLLNLFYTYFEKSLFKKLVKLIEFAVFITILYFYRRITGDCGNPICFLHPFFFPAIIWAFILIFKRTKYFSLFFIIIFLIPTSIIITDDRMSAPSYKDCEPNILKASFSPITLPITYFHQDNGKTAWMPNVVPYVDLDKEYKNKILYVSANYCSINERWKLKKQKENNIILCINKDAKEFTISTFSEDKQILVSLNFMKFKRRRNDLDLILHTTKGEYSCAEKLSADFIIKHIPYGKYLTPVSNLKSSLVLDLDGDGIETISTGAGVYFDHDNNQKYENTGWIGKEDAFLVRDINGNSEIDNGTEMFGNHTIKSDGTTAYNGFDALKDLDSNKDGKFDANDEAWDEVKLWKDKNTNGTVEKVELYTLAKLGIKHINLSNNYQTMADENNNIEIQRETYTKTDGTTGKISDVWFDINGKDTKFEETTEIPENIKQLPNIAGFGNVTSLHTAMAMDTTGTLKSLVEQYLATTDEAQKSTLLDNIIYHWTGVQNLPINGRDPTQIYGKVIDDTRKLEALEEFLGEEYLGTWCWGERDPNPHGQAAPKILQAYEMLKNHIGTILSANVKNNAYLKAIKLTYNAKTKHWDVDVSQAVALLQADYEENLQQGRKTIIGLSAILEYFDNAQDVYSAFQSYGVIDGTELEQDLLRFGNFFTGSTGNDTLNGSDDELVRLDEDNNCKIYTILNCKKINSKIEDLTCSDRELLKLYNEMQEKYFKLCKSLPNKNEQMKLYKDQTKWLNEQEMADYMSFGAYNRRIFYLKKAYQEKLNDLENYNK